MSRWHAHIKNDPRYLAARLEAFDRDGHLCVDAHLGGCTPDLQADHVIPLAELFTTYDHAEAIALAVDVDNLLTRCGQHNRDRNTTDAGNLVRLEYVNPNYPEVARALETGRVS